LRGFRFYFVSFFAVAPLLFLFWRRSAPSKDRNTSVLAYKQNKKNGAKAKTTERVWQWNQTKRHIYIFIYTNSTKCIHEKNQEHYYRWIAVGGPTTDGHPSSWFAERDRARQSETGRRTEREKREKRKKEEIKKIRKERRRAKKSEGEARRDKSREEERRIEKREKKTGGG
jgi:hypothetical protein